MRAHKLYIFPIFSQLNVRQIWHLSSQVLKTIELLPNFKPCLAEECFKFHVASVIETATGREIVEFLLSCIHTKSATLLLSPSVGIDSQQTL